MIIHHTCRLDPGIPVLALALMVWFFAAANSPAAAQDPPHYRLQANWHDTFLASLEAVAQSDLADGFAPFESEILRGGQPGQPLRVNVAGAQEMFLFVTGCPDVKWAVADWAEARLVGANGVATSLSGLKTWKALWGRIERDLTLRSGLYQKLRLGDRQFDHGFQVQADSVVYVPLDGAYDRFEAFMGVDAWAGTNGSVRFSVVGARTAARKRLWELVLRDFPQGAPRQQMRWEQMDRLHDFEWRPGDWAGLARRYAQAARRVPPLAEMALALADRVRDKAGLEQVRALYYRSRELDTSLAQARAFDWQALRLAVEDLTQTYSGQYPAKYLARLDQLEKDLGAALARFEPGVLADYEAVAKLHHELEALKQEALLANPLLNFDQLLLIKRKPVGDPRRSQWEDRGLGEYVGCPKQSSWANGTMVNTDKWDNELAWLSPPRPDGRLTRLYKPAGNRLLTDVDLHWDAAKLLFSMPDARRNWQVYELALPPAATGAAPTAHPRQLTPGEHPDVHNYDAIYLPNGKINFISTAPLQGVPCNAGVIVGMMYQMDADGQNLRQLCFEQDHDYTPSVLNNGRVLYLRWDYTDTPHVWNRLLMSMNPDGTGQMEYYGANSYWPNAIFFARAIPNHSSKIVGIVTGHHEGRVGELVIFDPAKGRQETDGVVQRMPGRGRKVEPLIEDKLTEHSWPKFLHPWPLSEKYFLAAGKPEPDSLWGIYLVDVFDNLVLLKEEEHFALLEPIPFCPRVPPPVIQDKTQPGRADALVYMEDVYRGPGLNGVPRGTVKNLRVFTYHFGYQTLAGIDHRVGADGPWEAKRVLGTVPVETDGSALFRVPAKTPLSFQPLDAEGKAVALMRSWMTAMPGENASCVGCHDRQSSAPPTLQHKLALTRPPSDLQPWHGPGRGFSFAREVQPVLDKYCVGCHNGQPRPDGKAPPDLRRDQGAYVVYENGKLDGQVIRGVPKAQLLGKYGAVFEPAYVALRQYVRVGGLESDLHLLPPGEFHADTTELVQMLHKGHQGVALDAEAWDRLVTWIDLNAPCHGAWGEVTKLPGNQRARRLALRQLYGGVVEDCENVPESAPAPVQAVLPAPRPVPERPPLTTPGWPLTAGQARQRQTEQGPASRTVHLGGGIDMEFVRVPAGVFVMGDPEGEQDEQPLAVVAIEKPFWMSKYEVSNGQYAQFDPAHDSRFEHRSSWIFSEEYLGWPLNRPGQPVVRVCWQEAMAFCRWLSAQLGEAANLPTEAQWEYACRAGTSTPLFYGNLDADFSRFANLGDASLRKLAEEGWRPKSPDLVPRDARFNDGALVTVESGRYQPNAWGLCDMHGNAAEWTRTTYQPYPYRANDGREALNRGGEKVVRGGSWRDRPKHCRSAFRLAYPPWQKVYNVGFRVILEPNPKAVALQTNHE